MPRAKPLLPLIKESGQSQDIGIRQRSLYAEGPDETFLARQPCRLRGRTPDRLFKGSSLILDLAELRWRVDEGHAQAHPDQVKKLA
jgi:hypothetical protein